MTTANNATSNSTATKSTVSKNDRPTWVATGPILPACMAIAVFVAAILNPTAIAIWIAFALCVAAVIAIVAIHFHVVRQQRSEPK